MCSTTIFVVVWCSLLATGIGQFMAAMKRPWKLGDLYYEWESQQKACQEAQKLLEAYETMGPSCLKWLSKGFQILGLDVLTSYRKPCQENCSHPVLNQVNSDPHLKELFMGIIGNETDPRVGIFWDWIRTNPLIIALVGVNFISILCAWTFSQQRLLCKVEEVEKDRRGAAEAQEEYFNGIVENLEGNVRNLEERQQSAILLLQKIKDERHEALEHIKTQEDAYDKLKLENDRLKEAMDALTHLYNSRCEESKDKNETTKDTNQKLMDVGDRQIMPADAGILENTIRNENSKRESTDLQEKLSQIIEIASLELADNNEPMIKYTFRFLRMMMEYFRPIRVASVVCMTGEIIVLNASVVLAGFIRIFSEELKEHFLIDVFKCILGLQGLLMYCGGGTLVLTGDDLGQVNTDERHLIISNHVTYSDWVVLGLPYLKYGMMNLAAVVGGFMQGTPLGFYLKAVGNIFVEQGDPDCIDRLRKGLQERNRNFFLLFPEGHVYTNRGWEAAHEEFAKKRGLPKLNYADYPRAGGLRALMEGGTNNPDPTKNFKWIIDHTIIIPDWNISFMEFAFNLWPKKPIVIHTRIIDIEDVPRSPEELIDWLNTLFQEKDKMIENYVREGGNQLPKNSNQLHLRHVDTMNGLGLIDVTNLVTGGALWASLITGFVGSLAFGNQ